MAMGGGDGGQGRVRPRRPRAWRGRRPEAAPAPVPLGEALLALLKSMGGTPERAGLQRLWDNWETVLGEELAGLAQPLGHRAATGKAQDAGRAILLLGAPDAMLLQELRFRGEEILERVNGFLGRAYFCEVKVSLPLGRSAPARSRGEAPRAASSEPRGAPQARGTFLASMEWDSPVARCYALFARHANVAGESDGGEQEENGEK